MSLHSNRSTTRNVNTCFCVLLSQNRIYLIASSLLSVLLTLLSATSSMFVVLCFSSFLIDLYKSRKQFLCTKFQDISFPGLSLDNFVYILVRHIDTLSSYCKQLLLCRPAMYFASLIIRLFTLTHTTINNKILYFFHKEINYEKK